MQSHKLRISLGQEMLGTKSADPDLVREFIASKRPEGVDEEEVEAVERRDLEEDLSRATTVFPRTKAQEPFIYDYQVVGFFKDACGALRRAPGTFSNGLTAYRKIIDGLVFVRPREIVARFPRLVVPTYPGDEEWFASDAFRTMLPDDWPLEFRRLDEIMKT